MNATYETFSDHSRTSTYDIAFLTITDISDQLGMSKSKLYKDIREGKLIAEKSLDDTLVVSPKALQQAYQKINIGDLFEEDFPLPDCLNQLEETGESPETEVESKSPLSEEQQYERGTTAKESTATKAIETPPRESADSTEESLEIGTRLQNRPPIAKLAVMCSAVIICSAILVGLFRSF